MEQTVMNSLINNAGLFLVLPVILEVSYLLSSKYHHMKPFINGFITAWVCDAIMSMPYRLQTGVLFGTLSIPISVTALIIGFVPAVITVRKMITARLIERIKVGRDYHLTIKFFVSMDEFTPEEHPGQQIVPPDGFLVSAEAIAV